MPQASLNTIPKGSHVHLMGICGTAMASLAGLLKSHGFKVTGSDSNPYPPMSDQIARLEIPLMTPYSKNNLHPVPDFVVIGNVISKSNEEAEEAHRLDLPYCSLPQAMGEFIIKDKKSFVVSGTHGKTTTTSLVSYLLDQAGMNPGFLIGGIPKNFNQSFRSSDSNYFVIEGDEYDTAYFDKVPKFVHYRPTDVILTSVEFDHADIYKDFDAVKTAFLKLMDLVPETGKVVFWGDDVHVSSIASTTKAQKYSYGFNDENYFSIKVLGQNEALSADRGYTTFAIKNIGEFKTKMTGSYNLLNATAALAICYLNGVSAEVLEKALLSFEGVKRRQEILGEPSGVLVIEDFAHHPTAVKETIEAIQKRYAPRKVFSVFEPRSATSRRKVFQQDYIQAFEIAHESLIAEAFDQTKINNEDRFSSEDLVKALKAKDKTSHLFKDVDAIVQHLKQNAKTGDVILIMSNGGFGGIYQKLLKEL